MSEFDEKMKALIEANSNLETQLQAEKAEVARLKQRLQREVHKYKRLQIREREQRLLKQALQDTVTTMSHTLDLNKVLDHILDTVKRVTPYDGANVLLVESDLVHVVNQRGYIEKGLAEDWLKQPIPIARLAALQHMMDAGKPLITPQAMSSSLWSGVPGSDWINSNVTAPIRLQDKTLGFLSLDSATPGFFTKAHAEQLQVFADQAAIAIQNARLYNRAKRAAVTEERSRLANELHDTISQSLWSISLISERLPAVWKVNREAGERSLISLHQLAQGALAEMRTLLLELRPSALMEANLPELIQQLADIVGSRTGLTFSVNLQTQEPLPSHVQVVLYRVVQEALNNIIRHASATQVEINFDSNVSQVELIIQDNGQGFDLTRTTPGHLGLHIMQDRIESIGATLDIVTAKNNGTTIKVVWIPSIENKND